MNITEYADLRYPDLMRVISEIECGNNTPTEKLAAILAAIQGSLLSLQEYVSEHPLIEKNEEINYFKRIKPRFYSHLLFQVEMYNIGMNKPVGIKEVVEAYYKEELKYIQRFFSQNAGLYWYYRSGIGELDQLYFLRDATLATSLPFCITEWQPEFTTPGDYLFSKFIAYERLQEYVLLQLAAPFHLPVLQPGRKSGIGILRWTGEGVNLVEIAYGIWLTGQINDGNASITEIIQWLETNLQVIIGRPNKRWNEISSRTRHSPVRFLLRMQEAIRLRIDEELAVSNKKRQARRTGK